MIKRFICMFYDGNDERVCVVQFNGMDQGNGPFGCADRLIAALQSEFDTDTVDPKFLVELAEPEGGSEYPDIFQFDLNAYDFQGRDGLRVVELNPA
jgi:hypothetical protein